MTEPSSGVQGAVQFGSIFFNLKSIVLCPALLRWPPVPEHPSPPRVPSARLLAAAKQDTKASGAIIQLHETQTLMHVSSPPQAPLELCTCSDSCHRASLPRASADMTLFLLF